MNKGKRWKPKKGEQYWYINSQFFAAVDIYNCRHVDIGRCHLGNCFESKEDADTAAEKVKALLLSFPESTQSVTQDEQLPKLTTEVFNRPDCPEWALYAAVDSYGTGVWFGYKPERLERNWSMLGAYDAIGGYFKKPHVFDSSDWENSLIERPIVLPDWCKVDAIGWCERYGYFKVTDIDYYSEGVYIQQVGNKSKVYLPILAVCSAAVRASLRPYSEAEMKALVGKPITMPDGAVCLCTAYSKQNKSVIFDNMHWDAQELMDSDCTIDDKPCFVLEHLENGEWIP